MPLASEYTYAPEQLSTQAKKLLSQETMDTQTAISDLTKAKEHEDLGKIQDNDIANVGSSNTGACCSIWPGWNAFTRVNYNGGTCWLKRKKGTTVNKAGVKSAEVKNTVGQSTLQQNVAFVDNDISNTPGKTPGDCCDICNNRSGCRSFSRSILNGGTC